MRKVGIVYSASTIRFFRGRGCMKVYVDMNIWSFVFVGHVYKEVEG